MEIQSVKPFLIYFGNVRERTMRVARCIPADKLDWSYAPGKFTLGDLLRHIAVTERYMWGENLQGKPSQYKSHGKEWADGYENILAFMDRLHRESLEIFAGLSDAELQTKCKTPGDAEMVAADGRARNSSPRPNLFVSRDARGAHAAFVWINQRGSPQPRRFRLNCCLLLRRPAFFFSAQ
jgi:uncharacterized damage-inducible protein DinB